MIQPDSSWSIVDSTKLSCFGGECKRKFFFSYILGWRLEYPNHDLYFGESFHRAREYQLIHGYDKWLEAYQVFEDHYRKVFAPETDEMHLPKTPLAVLNALEKYAQECQGDLIENELLLTETSGTVPIDQKGRVLHYRMDSVLRNKNSGKYFSWDHKSKKGAFNRQWAEKFQLSIQNGTYTHCLYCMFPVEEVAGVEFCGTSFEFLTRGSKNRSAGYHINFLRVPSFKTPDQMNSWLWTVNDLYNDLEREMDRLSHCKESDPVMMCFPMNDNSCTNYFGCEFHDYCIAWQNPLQRSDSPPLGFKTEFWNPSKIETTNKKILEWK